MKNLAILSLLSILLLPILVAACGGKESTNVTTTTTSQYDQTINITLDEFSSHLHVIKFIQMAPSDTLEIRLGTNPSTGYEWADAVFDPPGVVRQVSRNYEEPTTTGMVGAPGTDVWVFEVTTKGLTVLTIGYFRPFETGQEPLYSISINFEIK